MRKYVHAAGYTLVELLVVIAIIGILVSISVPAVNGVRARMRQAQCSENLRQLAIAASNYELSKGRLPGYCQSFGVFPGGVDPADRGSYGGAVPRHEKLGSWHVALLGELDNQPIYERWTEDRYPLLSDGAGEREATQRGYSKIAAINYGLFACPSASGSVEISGLNHYVANVGMHAPFPLTYTRRGVRPQTVDFLRSMSRANGVFSNQYAGVDIANPSRLVPTGRAMRSDDFTDGRSNTLLLTENHQAMPWHLTSLAGNANHLMTFETVAGKEVVAYPSDSRYLQGCVWHFEDDRRTAGAAAVLPIHKINGGDVYNIFMGRSNRSDVARPSSLHVSGVNIATAGGETRFLSDSVDYRVYQALMTPQGRSSDMPENEYVSVVGL